MPIYVAARQDVGPIGCARCIFWILAEYTPVPETGMIDADVVIEL